MHKQNFISIVYMGDSVTEGQYVNPQYRWGELIEEELSNKYKSSGMNLLFTNKGISGQTTRQGLERFPADVQNIKPDIMTLQFGLNDGNYWITDNGLPRVSESAFRANLLEMIERARAFGVEHIILSNNHKTLREKKLISGKSLEDSRLVYNRIIEDVAKETEVTFCDISKAFDDFTASDLEGLLLPYPDLLHLSPKGHEHYANKLLPYVEEKLNIILSSRGKA